MMNLGNRRWLQYLLVIRGTPLERIWPRLLVVTLVAVAVTLLHQQFGYFTDSITIIPFSLIALALGIFLGFRNNTSYDRFWEGRKLWGRLVNTTRSTARQIMTLVECEDGEVHKELVHRVIAYVHAFRHHLREEDKDPLEDAAAFLPEEEHAALREDENVPIAILHRIAERFRELWREGKIDTYHLAVLEGSLTTLHRYPGGVRENQEHSDSSVVYRTHSPSGRHLRLRPPLRFGFESRRFYARGDGASRLCVSRIGLPSATKSRNRLGSSATICHSLPCHG